MHARFDINREEPECFKVLGGLDSYVRNSGIDRRYLDLINIRVSQINGCAFCLDTHIKEARRNGRSDQWLSLIAAWAESPIYDDPERAVLNWAESVTNVSETGIPDVDYEQLKQHFDAGEIARLTAAVSTINVFNRVALAVRLQHPVDKITLAAD